MVDVDVLGEAGGKARVEEPPARAAHQRLLRRDHRAREGVLGNGVVRAEAPEVGDDQLEVLAEHEAPPELLVRVELRAARCYHVGGAGRCPALPRPPGGTRRTPARRCVAARRPARWSGRRSRSRSSPGSRRSTRGRPR